MISVITPAQGLPVDLFTMLRMMRIDREDVDLARLYLEAAVEMVEDYTGRSMLTKTFNLTVPVWPSNRELELRRFPLVQVDSVSYYAEGASVLSVFASSNYVVNTKSCPGRIEFKPDVDLPALEPRGDAIQVAFRSGTGLTPSSTDRRMVVAAVSLAQHLFDQKSPAIDRPGLASAEVPFHLKHILRSCRIESLTPVV